MNDSSEVKLPYKGRKRGPKTSRPRRMMIRMTPETHKVLFELAEEIGRPAATLITEFLEMNRPVFEALRDTVVSSKKGEFKQVQEDIDKYHGALGAAMHLITQGLVSLKKKRQEEQKRLERGEKND